MSSKKKLRPDMPQISEVDTLWDNCPTTASDGFLPYMRQCLADEAEIFQVKVNGVRTTDEDFGGLEIRQSILDGCAFQSCEFRKGTFVDMIFKNCDLSNSRFLDAYFERCSFIDCKCIGCDMGGSSLKHVTIQDTSWQYSGFDRTKLTNMELRNTDFTEVSISEAVLKNFVAKKSQFVKNNFFKTSLSGIDFRENEFTAPTISSTALELRGICITAPQAVGLIALWGISVE